MRPLTPALSPSDGERESPPRARGEAAFPPLPIRWGEGQGEGPHGEEYQAAQLHLSQLPALAIRRVDQFVGSFAVGKAGMLVVPFQSLAREAQCNRAEQRRLRERTTVIKI